MKKPSAPKRSVRESFHSKAFQVGGYSAVAAVIVIAIAVAVNLVVGALPVTATQFDTSANRLYTLSEQTEQLVLSLDEDVTVYLVAQSGMEDTTMAGILDRYAALSDRLRLETKDPLVNPTFAAQYTEEAIQNNCLIVTAGSRSRYIPYSDIYVSDYSQYFTTGQVATTFDLEGALTSAIDYVTTDDLPTLYVLTGHGEAALPASLSSAVEKQNVALSELSLLTTGGVPDDADCVLIYAPARDLSVSERDALLAFLDAGKNLLLVTDYGETAMPNLEAVAAAYGMERADGIVMEGSADRHLRGYAHYLLPKIESHAITEPLIDGGYYALFPLSQGIAVSETPPEGVSVTKLLTTSDAAYSKLAAYASTTTDFEEGDVPGPFAVAAAATKSTNGATARFVWFTSSLAFEDDANQSVTGANHDLFLNAIGWMCGQESAISIHAKSLDQQHLVLTASQTRLWTAVFVAAVPLAFVAAGIWVWLRRRAR